MIVPELIDTFTQKPDLSWQFLNMYDPQYPELQAKRAEMRNQGLNPSVSEVSDILNQPNQ